MNAEKLAEILDLHNKWLNNDPGGMEADLGEADLRGANLIKANLRKTDLHKADLHGANLIKANLRETYLREAGLVGANLNNADLSGADLVGAELSEANLRGALLYGTTGVEQFIFANPLGSRNDITQWDMVNDIILCGCFRGTIDEFSAKVEQTHANNPVHLAEYQAMIRFFKAVKAARFPEVKS
jgi:uncharacterized protein YjbI with pentapeptide repeats